MVSHWSGTVHGVDAWCWTDGSVEVMLTVFFICALIILVLEPKLVGSILYWIGLFAIGIVGFFALMAYIGGL